MTNFGWSSYKRQEFKALQQCIKLLEESDVSKEVDLIDQIDLNTLLEVEESTPDAKDFPLQNEFK